MKFKLLTLVIAATTSLIQAKQPNIILIMADDVSPEMYGSYGSKDAKTPNLDRMAKEGIMFQSAWGTALCCPSRAQIMTGCYATKTGFWYNGFAIPQEDGSNELFKHFTSFGKLMQSAGYSTAVAGKWHIGAAEPPHAKHVGFTEYCLWEGQKELDMLPGKPKHQGAWEDEKSPSRYWHPCIVKNHHVVATTEDDYGPDIFTDFLCDFMERNVKAEKPFLAYYPMVAPHGTRKGSPSNPQFGEKGDLGLNKENNKKNFRALNDYIDVLVGRLEKKAKDLGVMDNTIIIFCSDNGTGSIAKSRGTERGCRVPFIVYGAGIKKLGATKEICDLSDILPTLVDFAGETLPKGMPVDGKSLKPFVTGASKSHRDYIFSCIGSTRLVRNRTHLLEVVNPILGVPDGRFYHCGDSHDGHNYKRAESNPEHESVRKTFAGILDANPGLTKDHPYFQTKKGKSFLESYTQSGSVKKHLHNHKDYQFYDESLQND